MLTSIEFIQKNVSIESVRRSTKHHHSVELSAWDFRKYHFDQINVD